MSCSALLDAATLCPPQGRFSAAEAARDNGGDASPAGSPLAYSPGTGAERVREPARITHRSGGPQVGSPRAANGNTLGSQPSSPLAPAFPCSPGAGAGGEQNPSFGPSLTASPTIAKDGGGGGGGIMEAPADAVAKVRMGGTPSGPDQPAAPAADSADGGAAAAIAALDALLAAHGVPAMRREQPPGLVGAAA